MTEPRPARLWVAAAALALCATACTPDDGADTPAPTMQPSGRVLRIVGAGDSIDLDPGAMYDPRSYFLARGIYRTLVTYPAAANVRDQAEIVGDLATDAGRPSEGNTVWEFTLRPGLRYGPAVGGVAVDDVTGTPVMASDFRRAIERLYSTGVGSRYTFYYDGIEGARAFARGRADHISGIETPDTRTVIFRLTEPIGDWPHRLTLPGTAPVPPSAEAHDAPGGTTYADHAVATGPYYVATYRAEKVLRLKPNPQWSSATDEVRRPHAGAVQWRLAVEPDVALEQVMYGGADLVADVQPRGPILLRISSDESIARRFLLGPEQCTHFVWMNTTIEPFDNAVVRRAVNRALDRYAFRRLSGGRVAGDIATSVLPPGLPGHLSASDFGAFASPGMAGDMGAARRLIRRAGYGDGFAGEVLLVGAEGGGSEEIARSVRLTLERLGFSNITARYTQSATNLYSNPRRRVAVGTASGWCKDYLDPATFFRPLFHGESIRTEGNLNWPQLDHEALNAAIDRALALAPGADRADAWSEVDRLATRISAWVPWLWTTSGVLYGRGVKDPVYAPMLGNVDWVNVSLRARPRA